jgi:hypothetical protein
MELKFGTFIGFTAIQTLRLNEVTLYKRLFRFSVWIGVKLCDSRKHRKLKEKCLLVIEIFLIGECAKRQM